ncbi:MAG: YihY/virulence factor BrkB family protein [Opitutales bacterium]
MRESIKHAWNLLSTTVQNWSNDNAFMHAAAIAFYALFSLAPGFIIVTYIAGVVYGDEAVRREIAEQMEDILGRESAVLVEEAIVQSRFEIDDTGIIPTVIGAAILLVAATTAFAQLQMSLNEIWSVTPKPSRSGIMVLIYTRLLSLFVVLITGILVLLFLIFSTVLTFVMRYIEIYPFLMFLFNTSDFLLTLLFMTLLFGAVLKVLPDVNLRWGDIWKGAFLTAVLFTIGKSFISFYLGYIGPASVYGAAGSLVAILFFIYYSLLILLFGAEFTKTYVHSKGLKTIPKRTAVLVRHEIVEDHESEKLTPE